MVFARLARVGTCGRGVKVQAVGQHLGAVKVGPDVVKDAKGERHETITGVVQMSGLLRAGFAQDLSASRQCISTDSFELADSVADSFVAGLGSEWKERSGQHVESNMERGQHMVMGRHETVDHDIVDEQIVGEQSRDRFDIIEHDQPLHFGARLSQTMVRAADRFDAIVDEQVVPGVVKDQPLHFGALVSQTMARVADRFDAIVDGFAAFFGNDHTEMIGTTEMSPGGHSREMSSGEMSSEMSGKFFVGLPI